MLYKKGDVLISDSVKMWKEEDVIIFNPKQDTFLRYGYKPVMASEMPEYDAETQYLEETYVEYDDHYTLTYTVKDYDW